MFENLNQPYPFHNNFKHNLRTIMLVSMFFMLISLYFQPFGIDFMASRKEGYFILVLGMVSAATFFLNTLFLPGLMPRLFESARWTILKEIIWNIYNFIILIAGFSLSAWIFEIPNLQSLTLFRSGALALLPLVLFNLLNYNHVLKNKVVRVIDSGRHWLDEHDKGTTSGVNPTLSIVSENGKDVFEDNIHNVVLIQSSGNYIEVFYRKNGQIRRQLIRQTLSAVEKMTLKFPDIIKCHRCCLVNRQQVKRLTGSSPAYSLEVEGLDFQIPVSRQKIGEIRKLFGKHHS
ncbi:MAG: LytTR family DNA-binding domain-containing protein [Lentimicrobiaceae bacterium]|jgi:hypothetical protein|nr:LytTR family DNA-binding domain-containing protein [Lentimicrobiaceae bacterium]MDD4597936.1 LytTR family DNA-binding domain-containing protein [Lentimicrobiaceae bacterium]HAH60413.1 hypothetical protein [Bacteroidales bacterium]